MLDLKNLRKLSVLYFISKIIICGFQTFQTIIGYHLQFYQQKQLIDIYVKISLLPAISDHSLNSCYDVNSSIFRSQYFCDTRTHQRAAKQPVQCIVQIILSQKTISIEKNNYIPILLSYYLLYLYYFEKYKITDNCIYF